MEVQIRNALKFWLEGENVARSQYFMRMTRMDHVQLINVSAIHHAQYRDAAHSSSKSDAELILWFSDHEDVEPLTMCGHAAEVAWNALNELTIRAVFSVGEE